MDKKKMNSFDPTKVIVSVINLDVSDDGMDCHSALESVEKAFYEYMKNPFARNQSSKCSNQEESRQQIQEIKKRVMNASYIWMLNYKKQSRKSSFSLDDSLPKVYEIEKSDDSKVNLIKSKMKIPFSSKRLYLKESLSSFHSKTLTKALLLFVIFFFRLAILSACSLIGVK